MFNIYPYIEMHRYCRKRRARRLFKIYIGARSSSLEAYSLVLDLDAP